MKAPNGVELVVGQKWRDNYPYSNGYVRTVTIVTLLPDEAKVQIVSDRGATTKALVRRFNDTRGGYTLVEGA